MIWGVYDVLRVLMIGLAVAEAKGTDSAVTSSSASASASASEAPANDWEDQVCAVCWEPKFPIARPLSWVDPCFHSVHTDCLKAWCDERRVPLGAMLGNYLSVELLSQVFECVRVHVRNGVLGEHMIGIARWPASAWQGLDRRGSDTMGPAAGEANILTS